MTRTEANKYKKILDSKQAELAQVLRRRDGIAIEKSADALDEVQYAAERELAIRTLDRESNMLRLVRSALQRIEDGSYGICANCEEPINPRRLNAVPWAPYCIRCQEIADQARSEDEAFEDILMHAA
ncbi:MAG: TraR/DksA family transcriptional regulator [Bryobacteraceae bacterium]|nr:TraR/DksA family transcriptional regulator [Bryobacteraceae bacterium]